MVGNAALRPFPPTPSALSTPLSGVRPAPILASECLRDDLAPLAPAASAARGVAYAVAAAIALIGALDLALGRAGALDALGIACAAAAVGLLSMGYAARAAALLGVGAFVLLEGVFGRGPTASTEPATWQAARAVAAVALPGALLFRAHYRAYLGARTLLALAVVLSLPFAAHETYVAALSGDSVARFAALAALVSLLASTVGFMGASTTGIGSFWAGLITVALSCDFVLRHLPASGAPLAAAVGSALAFAAGTVAAATGLFQLSAAAFARDARCVDVHREIDG